MLVEQSERATHLRLAETLSAFLTRLRAAAETFDIVERQRIVRLVVKEVLVNDDTIVIRHCIPVPSGPPPTNDGGPNNDTDNAADSRSYLCVQGVMAPLRHDAMGRRTACSRRRPAWGPRASASKDAARKVIERSLPEVRRVFEEACARVPQVRHAPRHPSGDAAVPAPPDSHFSVFDTETVRDTVACSREALHHLPLQWVLREACPS